jgi:hypothetical protein
MGRSIQFSQVPPSGRSTLQSGPFKIHISQASRSSPSHRTCPAVHNSRYDNYSQLTPHRLVQPAYLHPCYAYDCDPLRSLPRFDSFCLSGDSPGCDWHNCPDSPSALDSHYRKLHVVIRSCAVGSLQVLLSSLRNSPTSSYTILPSHCFVIFAK